MTESDTSAREIVFWALWDNYSTAYRNEIIDALLAEHTNLMVQAVWNWIISVNNGYGFDAGDLAQAMENLGAPCPENLRE
jgi:ABC-type glycerol-3-phosphate transport system substrate-binding protein